MTLYQKKTIFHDYCTGKNEENWTIFSSNCLCCVLHIFNDWMTNPNADCYWNIKCQDCINDVVLYIYIKKSFCFLWIDTNKNMELKTLQPFLNYLDNYYVCDFFLMMHHMHHNWLHFTNQKITKEKSFGKNSLHFATDILRNFWQVSPILGRKILTRSSIRTVVTWLCTRTLTVCICVKKISKEKYWEPRA